MNSNFKDYSFFLIGVFGALISLYGLTQNPAQVYYVVGSTSLLITAIYFRLFYFIALEIILIAGHGAILLGIGETLQFALPILLCVQLMFFYFTSGRLNNIFLLIGILGIALLSVGFAYENQWVFFTGSTAISIYALYNAKRHPMSLLWAALNILFAITAIAKLLHIS